ncbi:endonuclease/exonuclease/phosphatase family protein [Pseudobacteriovorax antillogorgiicola]|uniref:Metal-dependent hydrolase, endonuclease/exonuclease/phosphatase family n=1 Tax=Pseudobacteriovorax antillogorgiicola TaxID=1513793 RepID=A0A1Y6CMM9_9BACT|nr:endonuclease/exonuclease/phosphatase family protein [Pseudobacteriovorax antillogorgiicola]TCS44821.1 endonuclease/exonuclease/phosphatase family metal-dependent hydrolase [Pseudobacteriovorax antillogorgiicola]SMF77227.1 Metal-dependent hydrolase, endonuclease/exonuclease/phosphatase family [Pseudobacteriovorax antillogorgiicola]
MRLFRLRLIMLATIGLALSACGSRIKTDDERSSLSTNTRSASDLGIMSFNIRVPVDPYPNDWETRRWQVYNVINRFNPDLVGLQESEGRTVNDIVANTPLVLASRPDTGILYNPSRLTVIEAGEFYYTDTPDVEDYRLVWGQQYFRRCVWVLFQMPNGKRFYHYNNHWSYISSAWQPSSELLDRKIAERRNPQHPFVITGDLNVSEFQDSINYLKYGGRSRMQDTFRDIKPAYSEDGTYHYFSGFRGGDKIDFVFAERGRYQTLDAAIIHDNDGGRYPSDHFPVYARIRLK